MKLLKNKTVHQLVFSFGGQIAFMLTNFLLFLYLVKGFDQAQYGGWALYITLISIVDGIRQGFVQNGFISEFVSTKNKSKLISTALFINVLIIGVISLLMVLLSYTWTTLPLETIVLLKHGWKTLISLGLLQFYNSYFHAHKDQLGYLKNNVLYLVAFLVIVGIWMSFAPIKFEQVLDIQLLTIIPATVYFLYKNKRFTLPGRYEIVALYRFGRYAAGTNLSSLLFHKVDILMIGYFLDPVAVAIYHLSMKIMGYAEIPMQAISQFIYPKLAHGLHIHGKKHLNVMYSRSIFMLLSFVVPISLILTLFNKTFILILSTEEYLSASELIMCFSIAMLFKPWGRVFGLSLDALGKPKINFMMLIFSLLVNVTLNWILIPKYGLVGGAIATTASIMATVIIGQIILMRLQGFNPIKETIMFTKNIKKHGVAWQ